MHIIRFQPDIDHARTVWASGLINTILQATDPASALTKHFDKGLFTRSSHILAFGKAAIPMTNAAIENLGEHFARATVITSPTLCAQTSFKNKFVELLPADHPYPSQQNIDSTKLLVEHAQSIPQDHQALALISGGASAMLCSPNPCVTLGEIIQTTEQLLNAGESIQKLNAARSKLETLKAGGLADALAHVAQVNAYVLSDVIGDDIETIGSGPLIHPGIESCQHTIIASNQSAVDALCAWVANEHLNPIAIHRNAIGNACDMGKRMAKEIIASKLMPPIAVCLGGEPTVDVSNSSGIGGPMLELALAGALRLARANFRWTIITLATDGIDGPTNAAGAIITNDMLADPNRLKDAQQALKNHDSLTICDALGATIRTGPTGTNVNDIALAIRWD